ncbi:Zinc finger BED domain-containing protein 4 [Aphelenchoides avenae]|nr:Zinc finger BED domain-containing protein 4 [Aphelenchus avenae]
MLADIQYPSFTCDGWSGPTCGFMGLTAHGVTSDWQRRRFVLAVREFTGSHTGAAVRKIVRALLIEWKVDDERVHCILHDQGSNMEAAFALDDIEDMGCAAHKINLICRNGIWPDQKKGELPTTASKLLTRCREVVAHFRHSHLAMDKLHEYQAQHKLKERQLVQDVATRWDSTYLMVHRLLDQRLAIDSYCVNNRRDLLLSVPDWEVLTEIEQLLRPFMEYSKMVCTDSSPLGVQLTVAKAMEADLKTYNGRHLRGEVAKMLSILANKFGGSSLYKNVGLSHALDPRFKDSVLTGEEAVEFRENVETWIGEHVGSEEPEVTFADLTRSPPSKKRSFLESVRAKLTLGAQAGPSASQPVGRTSDYKSELVKFLMEPTTDWDSDPLVYWKENASRYPLLAPVARRFLGAPASSAASEQTFSVAKAVYDPRRSKMSPRKAEALILLNRNLPLINYKY